MKKKWYEILLWIALASGVLLVLLLASFIVLKSPLSIENPINRKIAFDKLNQIQLESKEMMNSKAFTDYFDKALDCPEINTKWLISENGNIIYANGMLAECTPLNRSIYSLADNQSRGLINAIVENVDTFQKQIMYVAAAIRRDADENDEFGHLVLPLRTKSNELAGFMGVAYSLNTISPFWACTIFIGIIVSFFIYWLVLPIWVYFDCREKNNKYILWAIFVLFGNIPALIAYLISTRK